MKSPRTAVAFVVVVVVCCFTVVVVRTSNPRYPSSRFVVVVFVPVALRGRRGDAPVPRAAATILPPVVVVVVVSPLGALVKNSSLGGIH